MAKNADTLHTLSLINTISDDDASAASANEEDSDDEPSVAQSTTENKVKNSFYEGFVSIDDCATSAVMCTILHDTRASGGALAVGRSLDEKIASARRQKRLISDGMSGVDNDSDLESVNDANSDGNDIHLQQDIIKEKVKKNRKRTVLSKDRMAADADEPKIVYAEEVTSFEQVSTFHEFDLRRPLQKALTQMKYNSPMPIQTATIPLALKGRDVCACSATGTGKTAAFMIPTLERLLYRDTKTPVTRVLVLAPTRELAIQIYEESRKLAQFTDITICLSTGGLDIKAQEASLRQSPDIVIATPGRLIDHLRNAPSFNLANVEVLILDEADRMLDEFFLEQMKEVVKLCSRCRQTMLFSATMTENVKDLATVSLTNPVKAFVNDNKHVAFNLQQEFVRVRPHMESDREAIVAALVRRNFRSQTIVFIQTKKEAHRMHIVLGLLGVKVGELHGSLSQAQRLEALKKFKEGEIDVLIATDLAARGLDIVGVKTVINLTMPCNIERYIHRVGRTARAGKSGRSISLSGESERRLLHEICRRSLKAGRPVMCRTVPQSVVEKFRDRIRQLEVDIDAIETEEREEKELRILELKASKARNLLEQDDEIQSRPKRTWFQTHSERMQEIASQKLTKFSSASNKQERQLVRKQKPQVEDRIERELQKAAFMTARLTKCQQKDRRIRVFDDDDKLPASKVAKSKKNKSSFDQELTNTSRKSLQTKRKVHQKR